MAVKVTNKLAAEIRQARLSGLTYKAIMARFGISQWSARFHSSDINASKLRLANTLWKRQQRARRREP
jgi:hypothetical protein